MLLTAASLCAYANIFQAPFIFDDRVPILANPGIQKLWPPGPALWAPSQTAISGRPLVSYSFALNYAIGGYEVWGYHAVNLAIHIFNALLTFAVLRRIPAGLEHDAGGRPRAEWQAGMAALIWSVHPLLSEAVTYVVQRTELLMSFFLLFTIFAVRRSTESAKPHVWHVVSVLSSALGMCCKEVMAAAPIIVFLYDRTFLSLSFRELFKLRWRLYAGLISTWFILGALAAAGPRTQSAGFGFENIGPWEYLLTQATVIPHYLRLALFPFPLCIDYSDWPIVSTISAALPGGLLVLALMGLTVWAMRSAPGLGFWGAWFFLILAPSSGLIPIVTEPAAERRMYLPLLSVVFMAVLAAGRLSDLFLRPTWRRPLLVTLAAALTAGCVLATSIRNEAYGSEVSIWSDALQKRPRNARALNNLGSAMAREGRSAEAKPLFIRALEINSDYPEACNNLGGVFYNQGRMQEAIEQFTRAIRLKPDYGEAHLNLGLALHNRGRLEEAIGEYQEALKLRPGDAEIHNHLGAALLSLGRRLEAIEHFQEALRLRPDYPEARRNLSAALSSR